MKIDLFEEHLKETFSACNKALMILKLENLRFRPMKRRAVIKPNRGYTIGRTNLKTGLITIDIFTPLKREPKKISSILRTLCHEAAHHQQPPFRQIFKRHLINRAHYPEFYEQVKNNIEKLKKNDELRNFFS